MRKIHLLFILFVFPLFIQAQNTLPEYERKLKILFDSLSVEPDDLRKAELNQSVFDNLMAALQDDSSFYYPFDSLKYLGKIYSDDKKIRIYTWNIQRNDDSFLFYGFIQTNGQNKYVFPLIQKEEGDISAKQTVIQQSKWYGALYYKAIAVGTKSKPRYILLGWRQRDIYSDNVKLIDVLRLDKEALTFGEELFIYPKKERHFRVLFNYCPDIKMSLVYDERKHHFVFDHLSLIDSANAQSCKGPDFSYDAFVKRWGKWYFMQDIDVRNEK